jgi:hypothetical protein
VEASHWNAITRSNVLIRQVVCLLSNLRRFISEIHYTKEHSCTICPTFKPPYLLRRANLSSDKRDERGTNTRSVLRNTDSDSLLALCTNLGYRT